jgi:hypothetical protein
MKNFYYNFCEKKEKEMKVDSGWKLEFIFCFMKFLSIETVLNFEAMLGQMLNHSG